MVVNNQRKKCRLKNNEKTLTHWLANWFMSWKTKRKNKDDRVEQENDECLIELGGKKKRQLHRIR